MSEYKYLVEFAHLNDRVDDEHPLHHGRGQMEITVERPIVSQRDKDEVAQAIGRAMNDEAGEVVVTTIAVAKIEPVEAPGEVYIDYDPTSQLTEESRRLLGDYVASDDDGEQVHDITSLGKP